MLRPRLIPCLLVHAGGLVKTVKFRDPKYVGDPINAVRIFNEKEADELMVLDIDASRQGIDPDFQMIAHLAAECRMPLAYGGGVRSVEHAKRIISLGVEKVVLSAAAIASPTLVTDIADAIGRQSVCVVLDVRKRLLGSTYDVLTHNGTRKTGATAIDLAKAMQQAGAGEIIVNAIDRDGVMQGYDLDLARALRNAVDVPISILGGAGSLADIAALVDAVGVAGAAAGSLFVFKGQYRAVLISYPDQIQKDAIANAAMAPKL